MTPLLIILVALVLLAGFFALTVHESRRGSRYAASGRAKIDAHVARASFILAHVDFAAFLREEARRIAGRLGHDFAHFTLQAVRMLERLLTRAVRRLRASQENGGVPRETSRAFVKTLSDFKEKLAETRPEVPEL